VTLTAVLPNLCLKSTTHRTLRPSIPSPSWTPLHSAATLLSGNLDSVNQSYTLPLHKENSPVLHTVTVQLRPSITAGIHNSLLLLPHRTKVSDLVFKFFNSFSSVLMDQISQNVLKPRINFPVYGHLITRQLITRHLITETQSREQLITEHLITRHLIMQTLHHAWLIT